MKKITNDIWQYKEFMREYTKDDFKYADESLKKDKAFISKLIQKDYEAFEYIDENLKKDKAFILELLKNDTNYTYHTKPFILNNMSETLKTDNLFLEEIIELGMYYFVYDLKKSDKFLLFLIKKYGYGLEYATDEQQADRKLVLQAVKLNVNALDYVSDELKEDNDFILSLIKETGAGLQYATRMQKANKELVLQAIKHNPHALGDAHAVLRRKKEVVLEAIKIDPLTLSYAHKSLQKDKSFIEEVEKITKKKFVLVDSNLLSPKEATRIDLVYKGLYEFPSFIREFKQLKVLNLSDNNIITLPDWIGELDSLETLILDKNPLTSLPKSLTKLKKLRTLHILENYIEECSKNIIDFLNGLLEFKTSSKRKILELEERALRDAYANDEIYLYEVATEKMKRIRFSSGHLLSVLETIKLTDDKKIKHVLVAYKDEICILEIQRDNIYNLLQIECYEAQQEAYQQVKTLLHKKNVKLPLQIDKQKEIDGYKDITLTLFDNSSVVCHYNPKFHYYESEKPIEKQELLTALHNTIFKLYEYADYEDEDYLKEQDKKYKEMKDILYQIDKEHIYLLFWLLELDDFEYTKEVSEWISVEDTITGTVLECINKLDKTGELIYTIAKASGQYQSRAIDYLIDRKEMNYLKELMPLIGSTEDSRIARSLIDFFVENGIVEVLDTIKKMEKSIYHGIDMLLVRAKLQDKTALKGLIEHQHTPWEYKHKKIVIALDKLINHIGVKEVLMQLSKKKYKTKTTKEQYKELFQGSKNANIRYWALKRYYEKYKDLEFLMEAFKDSDWYIKDYVAKELIASKKDINERLKRSVVDNLYSDKSKYWLIYTLMKRGEDVNDLIKRVSNIKIELPSFISQKLRESIVKYWYKDACDKSDIRWTIEGIELENRENSYDYIKEVERLKKILVKYDYKIEKAEHYWETMQLGRDTFYTLWIKSQNQPDGGDLENGCGVIEYDVIHISKIDNFAYYSPRINSYYKGEDRGSSSSEINEETEKQYKEMIEEAGFNYITNEEDMFVFPRLNIYFFGDREPLRVHDLLFYWQN